MNKYFTKYYAYIFFSLIFVQFKIYSMTEMAIMMGAQEGGSMANKEINQDFQSISTSITSLEKNLTNALSQFQSNMNNVQKKEMANVIQLFQEAQSHIQNQKSDQTTYFQQMNEYLHKAISNQKPPQYYLLNQAAYLDELFSLGTMYTPQGSIWKNIFAIGNWEYDHKTNTFWQMQNVPFNQEENKSPISFIDKQYYQVANSIFTEYFTTLPSYEIICELTIHQVQYPFFVGIAFNKTRWISGSFDSITKCRLYGIYGASQNQIGSYFAEQYDKKTLINKKDTNVTTMYPLEQIVQQQVKPIQTLSSKAFDKVEYQPIIVMIKIKTSPSTIQFKIWQTGETEPKTYTSKRSINKNLYLYHNIGFLSSGAISQFKLLKPTELVFSKQAQQDFTAEVELLMTPNTQKG